MGTLGVARRHSGLAAGTKTRRQQPWLRAAMQAETARCLCVALVISIRNETHPMR